MPRHEITEMFEEKLNDVVLREMRPPVREPEVRLHKKLGRCVVPGQHELIRSTMGCI